MRDWIIFALLSGILYTFMNLIIMKLSERYGELLILFFVFLFGAFFYFITTRILNLKLNLASNEIVLLFIAAFLAFLANIFSLKAMVLAPNPAYASMISRFSYVLLMAFLATILLGRELSLIKFIGIFIMLVGAMILTM